MRLSGLILFFAAIILPAPSLAQITVNVSDRYSAIQLSKSEALKGNDYEAVDLPSNHFDDSYVLNYSIKGGTIDLMTIDGRDRDLKNIDAKPLLRLAITGTGTIDLGTPPNRAGLLVMLMNHSERPLSLAVTIYRKGSRPAEARAAIVRELEISVRPLNMLFRMPNIRVSVKPCGTVNAFSTPDIIICTELLDDLDKKDRNKALIPILYHEIGHSLLRIWEVGGGNDEYLADELAGVLLAKYFPSYIEDLIMWLEARDPTSEAVAHKMGDRHPLSIDRAQALREIIADPDSHLKHWGATLTPFLKERGTH